MDYFSIIKDIRGPFALIAFICALLAYVLINYYRRENNFIKAVKDDRQADIINVFYRMYSHRDTESLTRNQKYDLIVKTIEDRLKRLKMIGFFILGLILLIGAIFYIEQFVNNDQIINQKRHDKIPKITETLNDYILKLEDFRYGLDYSTRGSDSKDLICHKGAKQSLTNTVVAYSKSWNQFVDRKEAIISDAEILWDEEITFDLKNLIKDIEKFHRSEIFNSANNMLAKINELSKSCGDTSEEAETKRIDLLNDLKNQANRLHDPVNEFRNRTYTLIAILQNTLKDE